MGRYYESCLCNMYRDGNDMVGWHADDEPGVGPSVASISLDATRVFEMREESTNDVIRIPLKAGTLLIMEGTTQQYWKHRIPKEKNTMKSRVNITFIKINTSYV